MCKKSMGLFLTALALLMSGCGNQIELPALYTIDEDSLPSLQETITIPEESLEFSESTDPDTGEQTYTYSGLEDGSEVVSRYVSLLEEQEDCFVIDQQGQIQETAEPLEESGSLLVGRESTDGDGVFSLQITWDENSCTITPVYQEGIEIHEAQETETEPEDNLTLSEVVDRFLSCDPASLGLAGDDMSAYTVFPEEGYVMVDGVPGVRVNIYEKSTHTFEESCIITSDGSRIYRLDRETRETEEISA